MTLNMTTPVTFSDGSELTMRDALDEYFTGSLKAVGAEVPSGWTRHMASQTMALLTYFIEDENE